MVEVAESSFESFNWGFWFLIKLNNNTIIVTLVFSISWLSHSLIKYSNIAKNLSNFIKLIVWLLIVVTHLSLENNVKIVKVLPLQLELVILTIFIIDNYE